MEFPDWIQVKEKTLYFGQVFQKFRQYKCNLTAFWHGLLPNMAIALDAG